MRGILIVSIDWAGRKSLHLLSIKYINGLLVNAPKVT
jgi:hypothetical protein